MNCSFERVAGNGGQGHKRANRVEARPAEGRPANGGWLLLDRREEHEHVEHLKRAREVDELGVDLPRRGRGYSLGNLSSYLAHVIKGRRGRQGSRGRRGRRGLETCRCLFGCTRSFGSWCSSYGFLCWCRRYGRTVGSNFGWLRPGRRVIIKAKEACRGHCSTRSHCSLGNSSLGRRAGTPRRLGLDAHHPL